MKTKFISISILVLFSVLIGTSIFWPSLWAFLFCFFCLLLIFHHLKRSHTPKSVYIFIIAAIIIRIILAIGNDVLSRSSNRFDLMGDASNYTSYGVYIAEILTDKAISRLPSVLIRWDELRGFLPPPGHYQTTGMAYLQAIAISAFGYSSLGIKIFNSTLGILVGVMAYCFLKRRIGVRNSIIALALILFYPSLIIWSVTGLKESLTIFITFFFLITLGKMINSEMKFKNIIIMIFLLTILILFAHTLRPQIIYLYLAVFILSLFIMIFLKVSRFKKASIISGIVLCMFLLNHQGFFRETFNKYSGSTINYQLGQYRVGAKTSYKIYPDRFYSSPRSIIKQQPLTKKEVIITYTKATICFLFAPMPMHLNLSKFLVLVYPQSLFVMMLFPFMLVGIIWALRYHTLPFTPLFIFMVAYTSIVALMSGNMGTAFRHKDLIMPIYLIFSSIGIALVFGNKKPFASKNEASQ